MTVLQCLPQPAYGTSYVIGKIEIENLLAERRRQQGEAFRMRAFMDEFDAAGRCRTVRRMRASPP